MTFEEPMNLDKVIKDSLPSPEDHKHEWIHTYGQYNSLETLIKKWDGITRMYPYYICKHCHAVSNNFTESSVIKRVR